MGVWTGAAKIARRLGEPERAQRLKYKAQRLREEFDTHFFDEELGTYVLALDGNKKPCRIRTSNAGHALFAGVAYPERAASVVSALMDRSSLSGWGVRTVASSQASMIQSCLGMSFSPRKFNILFDEPVLPAFLDTIALRRLAVGGESVDLMLRRSGENVMIEVLNRQGPVRILSTSQEDGRQRVRR